MSRRVFTATAHPNIALVKYWGKRDERLILPHQSSLSVTLSDLMVRTTVALDAAEDEVELHGRPATPSERRRVLAFVDLVRQGSPGLGFVRVTSSANFPQRAGLASSAAAFAALAVALRAAARLEPDSREASLLARQGSGSACRSVQGGFCLWRRGQASNGTDSHAQQLFGPAHWPALRFCSAIVSREEKETDSRDGMRLTVETSPYYAAWVDDAEAEIGRAWRAIERRDLEELGGIAERNAWRMHATALAASPPLCYLLPKTLELIQLIQDERRRGLPAWFTLDAGPNPVFMTDEAHEAQLVSVMRRASPLDIVLCKVGGDAQLEVAP